MVEKMAVTSFCHHAVGGFFLLLHLLCNSAHGIADARYKITLSSVTTRYPASYKMSALSAVGDVEPEFVTNPQLYRSQDNSTSAEVLQNATLAVDSLTSGVDEIDIIVNRKPPLKKRSETIYSNIYSGLYNQPLVVDGSGDDVVGSDYDEVENTSFYSNIRYTYDEDTDSEDVQEAKSTIPSRITESPVESGEIILANARPPLVVRDVLPSTLGPESSHDTAQTNAVGGAEETDVYGKESSETLNDSAEVFLDSSPTPTQGDMEVDLELNSEILTDMKTVYNDSTHTSYTVSSIPCVGSDSEEMQLVGESVVI